MTRLAQTYLMVADVDETADFYETVFGLSVTERSETKAVFSTGDCELVVEETFDEETLSAFGLDPPGSDRGSGVIVVVEVEDVEAVHERALDAGATVRAAPREVDWGREMCLVEDPNGYVFELSRPL